MSTTDKLVAIKQFANYIEAELAKQQLADFGIEAVVTGANAANVYSIPAMGRPSLHVRQSQAEKALEILEPPGEQED
jgi:hypothetical protein